MANEVAAPVDDAVESALPQAAPKETTTVSSIRRMEVRVVGVGRA
ncbi:MAG: hypothetical protein V3V82_02705 [Acidimicrobiia bacterium]